MLARVVEMTDGITGAFSDMPYRHLMSELPEGYLYEGCQIGSGADLAARLFTEQEAVRELARAAEGVVRDLITVTLVCATRVTRSTQ